MRQNNFFPLISVLIPVYNAELFLVECLDGILSQTYPNLEIICLDDASTDGSFRLLTDYAAKDPRIKLIKQEQHHGIAVARNTLLRHISGEYFAFVDADDLIDPAYVEHLYQTASRTGADITRCLYNLLDIRNGSVQPCETLYREFVAPISPVTPVQRLQAAQDDSQVWLKLIKTSLIKEHHLSFIPHVLPEDISFEILLYQYANQVAFVNEHLYMYRIGNLNSASSNRGLCAFGTLEAMVFLCGELVRRNLVEQNFYEKIISLTLHAVRRMRKYSFPPDYFVGQTCRDAFDMLEKFLGYCGPFKRGKYRLMCWLAHKVNDDQLPYLACLMR